MAIDEKSPPQNGVLAEKEEFTSEEVEDTFRHDLEVHGFSKQETKKLLRKIDWVLLPFLALLYLLSFLDRANIGNARLAGLEEDLNMTGYDYNIAVAVFFPFYVAAEIPSNLAMKRFRPSIWIPSIMVAWGVCCMCMGFVHDFAGLIVTRCALGLAEGGLFPGITYYITMWYKRHECGLRMAIFFSAATAAGAFGGLLARGIMEMDGLGGKAGWAWIFIIEGLATIVVAFAAFFVMHDYPGTATFLTVREKEEVVRRLEHDRSALADEFHLKYFWHAVGDWKIWVHMFITIGIYTPLYSISIFLPTIVKNLGYDNEMAQLMTVPPYVVACVACITGGYLADKRRERGIFMIFFCVVAIIGYIMLMTSTNNSVKYVGTFFVTAGIYPNVPQGVAWNGNNIGGSVKRGVGIAMHVGFGNLGGAIAGFIYRDADAPRFVSGHGILLGTVSMSTILSIFMSWWLRRENKRRDEMHKHPDHFTHEERHAEREKGDHATFFRYTV